MAAIPWSAARAFGHLRFPLRPAPFFAHTLALQLPRSTPSIISFLLPAFQIKLPPIISGLWESILRAVPKKKTSHRKKRQRFLVGKALKDVTALNKCPACGNVKRAHLLCPYCVQGRRWHGFRNAVHEAKRPTEIKDMWRGRNKPKEAAAAAATTTTSKA